MSLRMKYKLDDDEDYFDDVDDDADEDGFQLHLNALKQT